MTLAERLNEDLKQAMKSQDKIRLNVLRMIRAAIKNQEIERKRALDEGELIDVLSREIKQRRESLQDFEKAGRTDLAEQVTAEIEIISAYLPEPLTEEEVTALVQQTIQETGASSKADMGKVMAALMPKVKGRADGKLVNRIVSQHLS
ncbi:MAG: aspartyl-tRNA amidotransferase [Thermobacillus sp. ZCTH02-B1]|uniref:GatB/YqeY domain-containing protein n=1 Tax=Thermobacillus sp. ZCTH02-B1 TaxID=1858795 RepID=UPI000B574679|nr:GatB/YqeY domain-containing protein [Thermobacillus sp. ZCTH02-B1]OUM95976.1 MAG: aspartyl-tRNA amidotransferase [Thermobacillus sp. ZCTH02-B1]